MISFADPYWLYLGGPIALIATCFLFWHEKRKRRRLEKFASTKLIDGLTANHSNKKAFWRQVVLGVAIFLLFVTLAGPQAGTTTRQKATKGIDIIIALDISRSMLARDVSPNRLERVKREIENQLDKMDGDRMGLIVFAGNAFLHCPLTSDHQAFLRTLDKMEAGTIKAEGTDMAKAIDLANRSFESDDKDRFLVLISDGDDVERGGVKASESNDVRIFTVGIGSEEGVRIPLDPVDKPPRNFITNDRGEDVLAKLDDSWLREIARKSEGEYEAFGPMGEGLQATLEKLQEIGEEKRTALLNEEIPIQRFQFILPLAIALLIVELLLGNRRRLQALASVIAIVGAWSMMGCSEENMLGEAEKAYDSEEYEKAAEIYESEIATKEENEEPVDPRLLINAGLAHFEAGNLSVAESFLKKAQNETLDEPTLQSTIYNALGNLYYSKAKAGLDDLDLSSAQQAWEQARNAYEDAVAIDGNQKAKQNLKDLEEQLKARVLPKITTLHGVVWRDFDGDGRPKGKEPRLPAIIYWDKNADEEHNASNEPFVRTNKRGLYQIQWISKSYPTSIRLGCLLTEDNASKSIPLLPVFVFSEENPVPSNVRLATLEKAGRKEISFPYRRLPVLEGYLWNDTNENGERDDNETGLEGVNLFLDKNGDNEPTDDEFSFQTSSDGSFSQAIPPGPYQLRVQLKSPQSKITFPKGEDPSHSGLGNFEQTIKGLRFGVYDPNQQENQNEDQNEDSDEESQSQEENQEQEVVERSNNALYKSLLEASESKSKPLPIKVEHDPNGTEGGAPRP
tara:strand:+ start:5638 stop:8019 length:2382 start_codon:yes stop_codon:yes gene_type:complete